MGSFRCRVGTLLLLLTMAILTIITVQATTNEIHLADDGFMMAELLDSEAAHVTHQGLTFEDGHIYAQAEDRSLIQQETQHSNSNEQENQHQHEHEHEHEASHESEHESDASTEQEQEGIGRLLKNKIQPKLKALKAKAGNFFKGLKGKAKNGIAKLLSAAVKPKASVPANPLVLAAQKAQQAAQEAQMKLQIQQQAQAKKEAEAKAAAAKKVADDAKKAAAVAAAAAAAAAKFAAKPPTPAGASGASTKPPTEMDLALAKLEANMAKKLGVKVKAVMERGVTRFVPLDAESAIRLQDWKRQRAERKRRERRAKEKARRRAEKKARREAKKARIAKEEAEKKAAEEAAIKKAEEERAARIAKYRKAKAVRDNLPNFSAHVPLPIPDPFIFKTPAPLKAGEVAIQQCSNEGRRRINMCINLMGSIMIPNENNQITFEEEHILNSCSNPKRSKPLSSGDQSTCRKLRAHIFNVADVRQLHQAIRLDDVHNVCVRVLGTDFNGQVWLSPEDGSQCHLSGLPERQNEGVTGSRCLFLHGSGVPSLKYDELNSRKGPYDGFLPSFPLYWKGVEKQFGSQCDKRFYVTETINRGWDDGSLQTEYCAAIQKFRPHTIFAHSTANNVLAAGIANNVTGCHLIAKAGTQPVSGQALWFGMNGAFKGTPLADVLKEQCAKVDGPTKSWYAGVCAAEYATPYHGFDALATTHINKAAISMTDDEKFGRPQFDCKADGIVNHFDPDEAIRKDCVSLPSIAAEYQSGSMCGVAPDAFTKTLHRFNAKSKTTFLKDDSITVEWGRDSMSKATRDLISGHDGLVPFASCRVPGRVYGLSPASTFYATTTNHDDGRCANGEGGSTLQQPCTWLTSRLVEGQTKFEKLQQFRDGRIVGVAPRATPLAPDFGSFRYDEEELKVSIQQQLTSFEEKAAVAQPVGSTVRRVIRRRRQRRPPPPIQPAQVIANQTDPAQEKKLRDDAAIKAEANLKAYLAAAA